MHDLRCGGCGRRVGFTQRTQAVPVQCTDVWCLAQPPRRRSEERDSFIEHLALDPARPLEQIGSAFGISRQGVARVLANA